METILKVEGMTCGHCKEAVEGALNKIDGVSQAFADIENGTTTVTHEDSVSKEVMKEAVEEQGYDVVQ